MQEQNAVCYLKQVAPAPIVNNCCVSGVRSQNASAGAFIPAPQPAQAQDQPSATEESGIKERNVVFSLGASIGFASYHAGDLVELLEHKISLADRIDRAISGDIPIPITLMCQSLEIADEIVRERRKNSDMVGDVLADETGVRYRWGLQAPPRCERAEIKAATKEESGTRYAQNYYNSLVEIRELWAAQLQKLDPMAGAAYRVGVNIAIAEGFASRDTDAAAIVQNGLRNALSDVRLLGLDERRLGEAIEYAQPGANMRVLHDMVMSMRTAFEGALAP